MTYNMTAFEGARRITSILSAVNSDIFKNLLGYFGLLFLAVVAYGGLSGFPTKERLIASSFFTFLMSWLFWMMGLVHIVTVFVVLFMFVVFLVLPDVFS